MHIGYIYGFEAYPPKGGNHLHAYEITKGFLNAGHQVSVVADPSMPGVTNYSEMPQDLEKFMGSIDILYARVDARFIRNWPLYEKCHRMADNIPIVWEINSSADEKLAFSWLGGQVSSSGSEETVLRRIKRWLHAARLKPGIYFEERYRRSFSKNLAAAICVSDAMGLYAQESLGVNRTLVIPNGGPLISAEEINERRSKKESDDFTVLYSGSAIYPWQGIQYLKKVIELAIIDAPEIKFILAVNQQTPNLQDSSNVTVLEKLSQDEIRNQMCNADVCVALPPKWPWARYGFHGSPMKLFDYMACQTAVVTSNHSQMKDILENGKNAILCENNAKDILDKIVYLKENSSTRREIANNAWESVQSTFNWKSNSEKTLSLFEKLIS